MDGLVIDGRLSTTSKKTFFVALFSALGKARPAIRPRSAWRWIEFNAIF
jgi:hypothetical protein